MLNNSVVSFYDNFHQLFKGSENKATNGREITDGHTNLATYSHMMGQTGQLKYDRTDACTNTVLMVLYHK